MTNYLVEKIEELEADVVVIGGGGAGLAAAAAAAECGAKIIILEKGPAVGGNSIFAEGLFAAESQVQRRLAIDIQRDDCYKVAMKYAHQKLNARLFRTFVDKSGNTIHWLEEKGVKFDNVVSFNSGHVNRLMHNPVHGGPDVIRALLKSCNDAGVRILVNTAAEKLLTGKTGKVNGVVATRKGKKFQITAKAVVISSGGYGGNKKMMKKYCSLWAEHLFLGGLPYMGDGIMMAKEAGAATEGLGILQTAAPFVPKGYRRVAKLISEPNIVWVNKNGERFIDEAICFNGMEAANAILRQPGKICYAIVDSKIIDNIERNGSVRVYLGTLRPSVGAITDLREDLRLLEQGLINVEVVDSQLCNGCGACIDACVAGAIKLDTADVNSGEASAHIADRPVPVINPDDCRLCGFCEMKCPTNALGVAPIRKIKPLGRKFESLEEASCWIGAEPETLKKTIDEYNLCCDKGYDPVFAKERRYLQELRTPPYYAVKCAPDYLGTIGGIRVNQNMEAVDDEDRPISGLYIGGVDAGGFESDTYCALLPGSTFGFAVNSGRIAGENAAKYSSVR
jgi:predicted oxidoreductase/NAD-dependent dihydropyrimidine dehydrogenase PreA subunit